MTKMLTQYLDLSKSVAYQEIWAEGKEEGQKIGKIEGKREGKREGRKEGKREGKAEQIQLLDMLLSQGKIDPNYHHKLVMPLKQQLDDLTDGMS